MTTASSDILWLTPAARARLQEELDASTRPGAPTTPTVERRVHELKDLLRRSEVSSKPDDGLVEPGMVVSIRLDGDEDETVFLLAQREIAAVDLDIEVYSPTSPLGAAIIGRYPGEAFDYVSPVGATVRGSIISATPYIPS